MRLSISSNELYLLPAPEVKPAQILPRLQTPISDTGCGFLHASSIHLFDSDFISIMKGSSSHWKKPGFTPDIPYLDHRDDGVWRFIKRSQEHFHAVSEQKEQPGAACGTERPFVEGLNFTVHAELLKMPICRRGERCTCYLSAFSAVAKSRLVRLSANFIPNGTAQASAFSRCFSVHLPTHF
jgi:hypothetical protein